MGAEPQIARWIIQGCFWWGLRWGQQAEHFKAKRQERGASPVGEEAEVPDADEASGEQVQQEAAQELIEQ